MNRQTTDYKAELNDQQYNVVMNGDGHCLVLAGAGSGKTRTLIYRVIYLIEKGVSPKNILLVTFTNKAAKEMTERCKSVLGDLVDGLWSGTFHHIANRFLRKYVDVLGYKKNYVILDESDSQDMVSDILNQISKETGTSKKDLPKASIVRSIISYSANSQTSISSVVKRFYPKHINFLDVISDVGFRYSENKKLTNSVDYDDLLLLFLKILQIDNIREKLSEQFKYILVDEYQDTNALQAEIIDKLGSIHKNILVVGDDAQSIYSFRAANIENILDFPKKYKDAKVFKLEKNYRSTRYILNLANHSIKNNKYNFSKELEPVNNGTQIKPAVVPAYDSLSQAKFIVDRIKELRNEEDTPFDDISVLFRSAFHSLELEVELSKHNIPYIKRGGIRYFEQAHIKDILAFVRITQNIIDETALRRVLYLLSGIGEATFIKIKNFLFTEIIKNNKEIENIDIQDLTLPIRARESMEYVMRFIKKARFGIENNISFVINTALRDIYRQVLRDKFDNPDEREMDINMLSEFSKNYDSVDDFLSDAVLAEGYKDENISYNKPNDSVVTLSTIHQAKGLEWKVVFVMHLVEGSFPHYKSVSNDRDLEEERRLFYVSVTRAKEELYLTYPINNESFYKYSQSSLDGPSRFLLELPENLYEKWEPDNQLPSSILSYYLD